MKILGGTWILDLKSKIYETYHNCTITTANTNLWGGNHGWHYCKLVELGVDVFFLIECTTNGNIWHQDHLWQSWGKIIEELLMIYELKAH